MQIIPLTQNKFTTVTDEDYEWLNQWKWCAHKEGSNFYAIRSKKIKGRVQKTIIMHRLIIDCPDGMFVDHIDGNGLNNQRSNLRIVTPRQNQQNRHDDRSSIYPGVSWVKRARCWVGVINIDGKLRHLGYFKTEIEAFNAYCDALKTINEVLVGKRKEA